MLGERRGTGSADLASPSRGAVERAVGAAAVVAALAACHPARPPLVSPVPPNPPIGSSGASDLAAWEIPGVELETQRLFRVEAESPEGVARLRLVLRLVDPGAFELVAAETFGRPVWTLFVGDGRALWLDHRGRRFCELAAEGEAVAPPPFRAAPFSALPAILLGRLPTAPSGPVAVAAPGLEYRDGGGRRIAAVLERGEVRSWTLTDAGGEAPRLWWRRDGVASVLRGRQPPVVLRWEQAVVEPLLARPRRPAVPSGFEAGGCG